MGLGLQGDGSHGGPHLPAVAFCCDEECEQAARGDRRHEPTALTREGGGGGGGGRGGRGLGRTARRGAGGGGGGDSRRGVHDRGLDRWRSGQRRKSRRERELEGVDLGGGGL